MAAYKGGLVGRLAIVGIAGAFAGNVYVTLKGKTDRRGLLLKRTLMVSGASLTTGLVIGLFSHGSKMSAVGSLTLTSGLSGTLVGGLFFSSREIFSADKYKKFLPERPTQREYILSAVSGASTGCFATVFTGGTIFPIFSATTIGFFTGAVLHLVYDQIRRWRYRYIIQKYYPNYAYELLGGGNVEAEGIDSSSQSQSGFRPYQPIRTFLVDLDDRLVGRTGRTGVKRCIEERKVQIQLLEEEEASVRQQLESIQGQVNDTVDREPL